MFQPRLSLEQQSQRSRRREQLGSLYVNKLLCELIFAVDFKLCVRFNCTTCGGSEFYENVFRCVTGSSESFETSQSFQQRLWSKDVQEEILKALATVNPPNDLSNALHEPALFLIHHALNTIGHVTNFDDFSEGLPDRTVRAIMQGTWAETVLQKI